MQKILSELKVRVNEKIYLKDPESSDLGKKIIEESILLINEIGFESFTFKKLGEKIGSNESSVYRYFENKHKLLLYLTSWYWGWLEYKLVFATHSISDSELKLRVALDIITKTVENDYSFTHIDEVLLSKIIISEYSKSYLTKQVDEENREGFFAIYKRLINRLAEMVLEVNPDYPYAKSLISTVVEGTLHQHFLKEHFNSITDCNQKITPTIFFTDLVFKIIKA